MAATIKSFKEENGVRHMLLSFDESADIKLSYLEDDPKTRTQRRHWPRDEEEKDEPAKGVTRVSCHCRWFS